MCVQVHSHAPPDFSDSKPFFQAKRHDLAATRGGRSLGVDLDYNLASRFAS
jgi:hypothetical protein